MFAALHFRWVLVWTCVIVLGSATQSTQGPAHFVTQPSIAIARLTQPQLKTKTDDYFLNPDYDSNNQDQDFQIRGKTRQKEKMTPAAKQSKTFLAIQGQNGKKSSTPIPLYETNPAVDELAQQLGGMKVKNPSFSASRSWNRLSSFRRRTFRSTLTRSKRHASSSSLPGAREDSDNEGGYTSL